MNDKTVIKRTGLSRIMYTLVHSSNGVKWMIKNEAAFQQELMLLLPLTILTFWIDFTALQTLAIMLSMLFVLFAEMTNTAIEAVVDRVGLEYHELSGVAKNIGSGIVTLSMIMSLMVWGVMLYTHFCA
ncbi:diacylglycerol kinase [Vibrio sp. S11_S32]|uniref:diacylglycerol kinase n=1 Tax=Vibrio sp. S11_S32 TaxID=2720225 RepID=UPI001681A037|nr:diacylglycerol kinase [Vibrio sp. S11_S32]MBD1577853.1 diacylglycerol kinase [Vibrio sp. S11_S32]